jgi:hypothetical protein
MTVPGGVARENLNDIAEALRARHGCHTAILYGSFAAGDVTSVSDYDIAGFANSPCVERISGKWRNSYLDLFEDYFHLHCMWYLGPKKSLAYLKSNAPDVHSAFEAALVPGATFGTIAKVVEAVAGPRREETVNDELMGLRPPMRSDV